MTTRTLPAVIGLLALPAWLSCAEMAPPEPDVETVIEDYELRVTEAGLDVRARSQQRAWLGELLGRIDPALGGVGRPRTLVSPQGVLRRNSWGQEREWPRSDVDEVWVGRRRTRGMEEKSPAKPRVWRVSLADARGESLFSSFTLRSKDTAESLAARLRTALGP